MFSKWFKRASVRPAIDRSVWDACAAQMPFLGALPPGALERLFELAERFARQKDFSGTEGFEITDAVRAAIALQACLPILRLGLSAYDDFVEVIVYPDRFITPRSEVDESGVVHESVQELSGETMPGGPVVLAWPDVDPAMGAPGLSVVIHEFAHKLDMLDGEADGVPPLSGRARTRWTHCLDQAYERFCEMLEEVESSIPIDIDPESEAADEYYARLPLDAYAATDQAEFFAVASEAFFTMPEAIQGAFPDLYAMFSDYFGLSVAAYEGGIPHEPGAQISRSPPI
jgi:Mlc titration factor MtfA (ptsG expression regulator)